MFTKTKPRRLGFPLSTSTHSTLAHDHSRAPTASTWAYPIQVRFPLPTYEDPCASFTETEPWRLGFPFHLNSLPLVRVPFLCPHCLNLGLPHPSYIPTIQIRGYPHVVHRNQAPVAQFLHFYLNSALTRDPFTCPHCLNLGLPHPSWIPTTQLRGPPCIVHQNRAPAAQFLHFYLNAPPSHTTHSCAPTAST